MKKTAIQKRLDKINHKEIIFNKLVKFLKSEKGEEMVRNFHTMPVDQLILRYKAPNLSSVGLPHKRLIFLKSAITKANMDKTMEHNIYDYTLVNSDGMRKAYKNWETEHNEQRKAFVDDYKSRKIQHRLFPYEMKMLNKRSEWDVRTTKEGKPMVKCEKFTRDGELAPRMLYDKLSGLPILLYKKKVNKLGLSFRLHMLEQHKMEKYDRKHIVPTEKQITDVKRTDLFPETIDKEYVRKQLREAHLEQVRKDLSDTYCPVPVHVILVDRKNDNVKQLSNYARITLGKTRSDTLDFRVPFTGYLKNKLRAIMETASKENPGKTVSCVHLTSHNPKRSVVVMPHMVAA